VNDQKTKEYAKRYYRKRVKLFLLLNKIKLWTSRRGVLHGIRGIEFSGDQATITTHCNKTFAAYNSSNSRAARYLRNKLFKTACAACRVPEWKLAKYASTRFNRNYGSSLHAEAGGLSPPAK
jgi:pyrrolysyl-tRNA synthetase-like protein